tara:strand:- start:472 stop:939 length:468 start_codon:yes stop_codon:yes gene_type:complete
MTEEVLSWVVKGEPKAQPRPRAVSIGGKARMYNPKTAKGYKQSIGMTMHEAAEENEVELPIAGHVFVDLHLYFKRPQRLCRKKDPPEEMWHTSKPDCDNVAKAVLDAITDWGGISDDKSVVALSVFKKWVAKEEGTPRTEIMISREAAHVEQEPS